MAKILLIAPTCDDTDVGEAWVAAQWAKGLSARHDLTLLTYYKRGHTPASLQLPNVEVVEWQEPPLLGSQERLNSMLKPAYVAFYVRARVWIRSALSSGRMFDAIHQPVPVAMRYPSPGAGWGIPLILGPVGGALSDPADFKSPDTTPWYVQLRRFDHARLRHDPLLRRTYANAACVLGIAPYVRDNLTSVAIRRFEVMSETGLTQLPPQQHRDRLGPLKLLFVGRLIKTKGARFVIEALSFLDNLDIMFDIVGDGPDRLFCEDLARRLAVEHKVRFHGWLPPAQVHERYRSADLFVFPSYREPGGNVVWEALGHGLPAIVCDRGGPAATVTASCGIKLEVKSQDQLIADLSSALRGLATQPGALERLSAGARARVADSGLWANRFDQFDHILRDVSS